MGKRLLLWLDFNVTVFMPDLPVIKVVCAILEAEGRVLVTQRSPEMAQPLLWEFPGGKIEEGEAEQVSLVREIREKLQLDIEPVSRLTPVVYDYGSFKIELIPYTCRYRGGNITLAEHQAHAWVPLSGLKNFDWCPADVPVVEEYLQLRSGSK
ncbi:(deoxy)nucleoside triphosphate pyrophosphohydrolase [Botryobacter ruber]|uniref:(deoxy)nucleoside triphosphate pyrophosphohydrolase n=1 Tax=Botryobacter ruber TaxID=2171629 RepID=UPI001F0B7D67|nr:(deoxy)nucleoside triphosphate pyrophosphohydrolase [Botryobacter ruber]